MCRWQTSRHVVVKAKFIKPGFKIKVKQIVELVETRITNLVQTKAAKEKMKVQKATTLEEE